MGLAEVKIGLEGAGLKLDASPTRISPAAALIADNVEYWPRAAISKRGGYDRYLDGTRENYPVTGLVVMSEKQVVLAGDVDEFDA